MTTIAFSDLPAERDNMTINLCIGYRTRNSENVEELVPNFRAPAHWKDPEKIAAEIELQKQNFIKSAKDVPYTGTFDQVVLLESGGGLHRWSYVDQERGESPVSVRLRDYLLQTFPLAWDDEDAEV